MIFVDKVCVMNMENAIRGARNPMNSWERSDSYIEKGEFVLGSDDLALATKLCKSGSSHRKFMRQVFVSMDITAPLYFWKEFDTYKVGTVTNSASTMHKIHTIQFNIDQFSHDKMSLEAVYVLGDIITYLEFLRKSFLETKDKSYWYSLIQLLPSSYNQLRTCSLNYEVLLSMYHDRKNHKLNEWQEFCKAVENLPYAKELIVESKIC